MGLKAIETRYSGYRFRSRLEARWAVFFDALGIPWEYEKEGFDLGENGWYLPDFWLPDKECWVEIKGTKPDDRMSKAYALEAATDKTVFVQWGLPTVGAVGCYGEATGGFVIGRSGGGYIAIEDGLVGGPKTDIHQACLAARSARFEFGEYGA